MQMHDLPDHTVMLVFHWRICTNTAVSVVAEG